jgi:hypothetical protein
MAATSPLNSASTLTTAQSTDQHADQEHRAHASPARDQPSAGLASPSVQIDESGVSIHGEITLSEVERIRLLPGRSPPPIASGTAFLEASCGPPRMRPADDSVGQRNTLWVISLMSDRSLSGLRSSSLPVTPNHRVRNSILVSLLGLCR